MPSQVAMTPIGLCSQTCFCLLPLGSAVNENGDSTTKGVVCSAIRQVLTPCDLFLWGYVKDTVYVPPLPRNLQELQNRIVAALGGVTMDMLQRVWEEIDCRLDVCRVTLGAHIEGL
jgi:hypothetical protein